MIIAVSGGIGSGKTRVCREFAQYLHAKSVSADGICKDLLAPGAAGYRELQLLYGNRFFLDNDRLDRGLLRRELFSDSVLRKQLDGILHPMVREEIAGVSEAAVRENKILIVEVPLLFEKGWQGDYDLTLLVYTDPDTCVQRIQTRDLVTEKEARQAVAVQMDINQKKKLADIIIDNSGSFQDTCRQLRKVKDELLKNKQKNP